MRYFAAFLLEYAYWIALGLALVAGVRLLRSEAFVSRLRAWDPGALTKLLVGSALGLHFAYYTFLVGGDHFEFRVYQHWVPLVLVGFAALGEQAGLSPRKTLAALALMILVGWPLPWLHWLATRERVAQGETRDLRVLVAPLLPLPVRWYGAAWDDLENWLDRALHRSPTRGPPHLLRASARAFPDARPGPAPRRPRLSRCWRTTRWAFPAGCCRTSRSSTPRG